jgi:hypothetical protein
MAIYITRTGTATAKQVNTAMTTQGSSTSPGGFTVPTGTSNLIGIIATIAASHSAATTLATVFVRITGQGVGGGEQDITIGSTSGGLTTSGFVANTSTPVYIPTSIPCTAGAQIQINFDTDTGGTFPARVDVCVTMVFA